MQLAATPSAIDLAYHVKAGELMVEQRAVLRVDVLAWPTAGGPWLDQNWGAQVLPVRDLAGGRVPAGGGRQLARHGGCLGLVAAACRRRTPACG
jgi:hypothetical protein